MRKLYLLIPILFLIFWGCQNKTEQLYGFYKSDLGKNFKNFEHNIYGFRIDIPNNWFFGVVGTDFTGEILIYPEGLKTNKISKGYNTISISNMNTFLETGKQIDEICSTTILGKLYTQNINLLTECNDTQLNDYESVHFKTKLNSKTGFNIVEDMYLVKHDNQLRSVSIRYEESIKKEQLELLYELINTIEIFKTTLSLP
tara:strand:- start:79 stop:678 length:600 start_codon:yes stop_codon:yes gene_type:complete